MARKTESVLSAVYATLKALPDDPRDAAIRAVAKRAAQRIDDEGQAAAFSALIMALRELRATPRSRGAEPGRTHAGPRPIDDLRERRRARLDRAAALD